MSSENSKTTDGFRELRNAFGVYPTGVTVATCRRSQGSAVGVTANSFVSLSLSPPLVSIALHRAARHLQAFLDAGAFTVNVLHANQYGLANLFATPSKVTWEDVDYRIAPSGHVVLSGTAAWFLCQLRAQHPVGDHLLLVGAVEDFGYDTLAEPLAFARGRFGLFQLSTHALPAHPIDEPYSPAMGWG